MSIRRTNIPKLYCVWDETGGFALVCGSYAECVEYIASHS